MKLRAKNLTCLISHYLIQTTPLNLTVYYWSLYSSTVLISDPDDIFLYKFNTCFGPSAISSYQQPGEKSFKKRKSLNPALLRVFVKDFCSQQQFHAIFTSGEGLNVAQTSMSLVPHQLQFLYLETRLWKLICPVENSIRGMARLVHKLLLVGSKASWIPVVMSFRDLALCLNRRSLVGTLAICKLVALRLLVADTWLLRWTVDGAFILCI